MKLRELMERNANFDEYRKHVEDILGFDLKSHFESPRDAINNPEIEVIRRAFLRGMHPDEAAELLQSGEMSDRFEQGLDDEELAGMSTFDAPMDDEQGAEEDDFDYTEYSMRQGEKGTVPGYQR